MVKNSGVPKTSSTLALWEELERMEREQVKVFIHAILEEEVTGFLGRRKSERVAALDAMVGYRNRCDKPWRFSMS